MSRPKSLQRQLAFETIHYVSVSKMGQAILNKNPRETRKLTEKLEDIEFHERKWKSDFSGELNDARQDYNQARSVESSSGFSSYPKAKGGKVSFNLNKPQRWIEKRIGRIYQQPEQTSETTKYRKIQNTSNEPTRGLAGREKSLRSLSVKKKSLTTDIDLYTGDKMSHVKGETLYRGQGSVTPHCMTPFIRHSYRNCTEKTVLGDVTKWHRCETCDSVVPLSEAQSLGGNSSVLEKACISLLPSCSKNKALSNIIIKNESCFLPPYSSTQKSSLNSRPSEIILKTKVDKGFVKREKTRNLMKLNFELRAEHSLLLSPLEDSRFVGLQSVLVPITNNGTKKSRD